MAPQIHLSSHHHSHRDNVTAPTGRPNFRIRLHFSHSRGWGETTKSERTCGGIGKKNLLAFLYPFRSQLDTYVPFTNIVCKSAGLPAAHFFSMLPSTLNYLYSVKPVRMHFPVKQRSANDTECSASCVACCCDALLANFECFSVRLAWYVHLYYLRYYLRCIYM